MNDETWQREKEIFLQEWFDDKPYVTGHTSGSTGAPKEVRLLKTDMLASARVTNDFFGITATSKLLLCLSPTYIAGKMMIVRALLADARLICVKPSASPLAETSEPIDLAAMVPMQVEETLKSAVTIARLQHVKQLLIGGAPVAPTLKEALLSVRTACFATYGMTETVSHIALKRLNGTEADALYFALGEVTFETDERDCLLIHTPHLHQRQFITNDIVRLADATHFEWIGRYDHVINSGGVKLSPESIEERLAPLISGRFFITSQPDERLGEKVILLIEGTAWSDEKSDALRRAMAHILTKYELPKDILFREKFRETTSGKLLRF